MDFPVVRIVRRHPRPFPLRGARIYYKGDGGPEVELHQVREVATRDNATEVGLVTITMLARLEEEVIEKDPE